MQRQPAFLGGQWQECPVLATAVSSPSGFFCFFPGFLSYSEQMTLFITQCVQQSWCRQVFIWTALALFCSERTASCFVVYGACVMVPCHSITNGASVSVVVKKSVYVVCSTGGQNWLEIPNVITELLCELVSVFPSL